jgi:predicted SAM-dependent methyltransferase
VNAIRAYLEERQSAATRGLERGRGADLLRRVMPHGMRQSAKVNGTKLLVPWSKVRIRRLVEASAGKPFKLHLGSGGHPLEGWVNIDILGMEPDLYWDLRSGIPFPDGSADAVFLEHVIEHFTLADDLELLEECRRVLVPGGIIRLGVPDFGRYLMSYAGDGAFIEELRPGRPTRLLATAEVALGHGHRSVWDGETLEKVLTECGFSDARRRDWGDSDLDPAPDSEKRRPESVYAEARRP